MIKKPLLALALIVPLAGCAMPTPVSIASFVFDVGSYALTGKTVTDHGLSLLAQQDCAMMKVFEGQICEAYPNYENVALATLQPLTPGSEEWAFAGAAARDAGPLSDLEYIEVQSAALPNFPTGRDNGESFRSAATSTGTPSLGSSEPGAQVASLGSDGSGGLLGLDGYLSDATLPGDLQ